jgi:hypothetical protein
MGKTIDDFCEQIVRVSRDAALCMRLTQEAYRLAEANSWSMSASLSEGSIRCCSKGGHDEGLCVFGGSRSCGQIGIQDGL